MSTSATSSAVTSAKSMMTASDLNEFTGLLGNSWIIKTLLQFIPGAGVLQTVITQVISYIDTVEKVYKEHGSGVIKKTVVVSATVQFIDDNYHVGSIFNFIVEWAVGELVDAIIFARNKWGWDWLPEISQ